MICAFCNGQVEWRGPWSNLTHTECLDCGRINCQRVEDEEPETPQDCTPADLKEVLAAALKASLPTLSTPNSGASDERV